MTNTPIHIEDPTFTTDDIGSAIGEALGDTIDGSVDFRDASNILIVLENGQRFKLIILAEG